MHLEGSHVILARPQEVWDALQDPAVLVATIPGCLELRQEGPDTYRAQVRMGIASLMGIYDGRVVLRDQDPPRSYVLHATGQGAQGTVDATVRIRLSRAADGTRVDYDADTVVGGAVAGVGQRVIAGVAKRNASQFFTAVEAQLTGEAPALPEPAPPVETVGPKAPGAVFRAPPPPPASDLRVLLLAAAAGAALALLGVLVGSRLRRR
jgi:uncharacterized protein